MKLAVCFDNKIRLFDLEKTTEAFFQGNGLQAGYKLRDEDDFIPGGRGEYLGLSVLMGMYEGAEAAGSHTSMAEDGPAREEFIWSWAVLPETDEEARHLLRFCPRTLFRTGTVTAAEEPTDPPLRLVSHKLATLRQRAAELGLGCADLDDLVHDEASAIGSAINNGGLDEQLVFLCNQLGLEGALRELEGRKHAGG